MSQIEDKKQMKFCNDCKWYNRSSVDPEEFSKCWHPNAVTSNKVTGKLHGAWCDVERKHNSLCGEEAKRFEPKENIIARIFSFFRKDKS